LPEIYQIKKGTPKDSSFGDADPADPKYLMTRRGAGYYLQF